jgi:ABC-2 type transport system ATP-binding protein
MTSAVECEGLRRTFGKAVAVQGLDLEIPAGCCFGLLGPNGAGKTTTIRMLSTLLTPSAGSARVLGHDVASEAGQVRRDIGLVLGGDRGLYNRLTGRENLLYQAALHRLPRGVARTRVDELLALVDLTEAADQRSERYSRGMKQRLHIARGLVTEPKVLFLDEPTIGIDPVGAQAIRQMVPRLVERGCTVLLTTHYMHEADQLCQSLAVIDHGRLLALGSPTAIKRQFSRVRILELVVREPEEALADRLLGLGGVRHVEAWTEGSAPRYFLHADLEGDIDSAVRSACRAANVLSLTQREPTLEEAYIALIREHAMRSPAASTR